jgi:hypothetical protein
VEDYCLAVYCEVGSIPKGLLRGQGRIHFYLGLFYFLGRGKGPVKREGAQIANSRNKHNIHNKNCPPCHNTRYKDGIKNINKIIVRKNVRVAKITIGKLVPTKIGKMSEIGHVVYCRL